MSDNEINFNISGEAAAVPGKALADALAANTVLTELNLSKNNLKPEFIRELAVGIGDNGAMTSLDLSWNTIGSEGAVHVAEAIKVKQCVVAVVLVPKSC
jgi:Ran GTPase-activating protein (RanGAP) involved in mRNA processing and transport